MINVELKKQRHEARRRADRQRRQEERLAARDLPTALIDEIYRRAKRTQERTRWNPYREVA